MDTKGIIFDLKRFAVHDGPGIRTTVFLKGCPLRCDWCHNPESQSLKPILAQFKRNCIGCEKCVSICPQRALSEGAEGIVIDRSKCQGCGACAAVCYAEALVLRGRAMTVSEVLAEVEKDRPFYENSGGGLTVSGGEPLYQPAFSGELLQAAHAAGLHTCLDTCGYAPWSVLEQVLPYVDLVLYDLKGIDPASHRRRTGRPNSLIMQNLRSLTSDGVQVKVRSPLVPGYNDTREAMEHLAGFILDLAHIPPLELLPYHKLGEGKYEALGIVGGLQLEPPERTQVEALAEVAKGLGLECEVGG